MLCGRMQTAAGIPLHTNGAKRDIRRLPLETVDEIVPEAPSGPYQARLGSHRLLRNCAHPRLA